MIVILGLCLGVGASTNVGDSPKEQTTQDTDRLKTYFVKFATSDRILDYMVFGYDETHIIPEKDGQPDIQDDNKDNFIYPTYIKRPDLTPTFANKSLNFNGTSLTKGRFYARIPNLENKKYKVKYIDQSGNPSTCYAVVDVGAIRSEANLQKVNNIVTLRKKYTALQNQTNTNWSQHNASKLTKLAAQIIQSIKDIEDTNILCSITFGATQTNKDDPQVFCLARAVFYFILGCLDFDRENYTDIFAALDIYSLYFYINSIILDYHTKNRAFSNALKIVLANESLIAKEVRAIQNIEIQGGVYIDRYEDHPQTPVGPGNPPNSY